MYINACIIHVKKQLYVLVMETKWNYVKYIFGDIVKIMF